jgi:hypothetical protein
VIKICKIKIDKRGRLSLPMNFLVANKIKRDSYVSVHPVSGRTDAVRLEFDNENNR